MTDFPNPSTLGSTRPHEVCRRCTIPKHPVVKAEEPRSFAPCRKLIDATGSVEDLQQDMALFEIETEASGDDAAFSCDCPVDLVARKTLALADLAMVDCVEADLCIDPACDVSAEDALIAKEALSAIAALPDKLRDTLLLVCVEGKSYQEAADILEIPVGTVMSRLYTARKRLKSSNEAVAPCEML